MSQEASQSLPPRSSEDYALALLSAGQSIPQTVVLENSLLQPRTRSQPTLGRSTSSMEVTAPALNVPATNDDSKFTAKQQSYTAAPRTIPSLLCYVDVELMTSVAYHNHHIHPNATCCICFYQWDTPISGSRNGLTGQPALMSTFLPLSPCSHWVHYRCLIWLASKSDPRSRDECPQCHTRLYQWEGITAFTLAIRTGIDMEDDNTSGTPTSNSFSGSHRAWYEYDCDYRHDHPRAVLFTLADEQIRAPVARSHTVFLRCARCAEAHE